MGGTPKTAMNIVAYPIKEMGPEPLKEMLAGGADKVREAEAVLLGGHSIEDKELKYGLSITGFVHPDKILANQGFAEGDCLVLTKPLGTGIINTAIKGGLASTRTSRQVIEAMSSLNKTAAEVMADFPVSACTDVTGFGLLGHIAEMIESTSLHIQIDSASIPLFEQAYEFGSMGLVPEGAYKNRKFREQLISADDNFDPVIRDILFDPQTSGGLLIGCQEKDAAALVQRLHDSGIQDAAVIGTVEDDSERKIQLT